MPAKNSNYLKWIRTRPCTITMSEYNVIAHHITISAQRGFGLKPSDYWAVPLRADLHSELHHIGERRFWAKYDVLRPHSVAYLNITYYFAFVCKDEDVHVDLLRHLDAFCVQVFRK